MKKECVLSKGLVLETDIDEESKDQRRNRDGRNVYCSQLTAGKENLKEVDAAYELSCILSR